MKLLCFSDIHNSPKAIAAIVERSADVDVVIGAGDFCLVHRGLEDTIDQLSGIQCPAVFVPGNSETDSAMLEQCEPHGHFHVLHGNGITIKDVDFFGLGGGVPVTPFGSWSWDFSETQARDLLTDCPEGAVLVSHSPPRDCLDLTSSGIRVGSSTVRNIIREKKISLTVCGHIHESSGKISECYGTPVINAGPWCVEYELE
jgi:Icc-related predicted phosphoesterase